MCKFQINVFYCVEYTKLQMLSYCKIKQMVIPKHWLIDVIRNIQLLERSVNNEGDIPTYVKQC